MFVGATTTGEGGVGLPAMEDDDSSDQSVNEEQLTPKPTIHPVSDTKNRNPIKSNGAGNLTYSAFSFIRKH